MKIHVALLCTVLLVSTAVSADEETSKENMRAIGHLCAEESGLQRGAMRKIMREHDKEELKKFGCFLACSFREFGAMAGKVIDTEKATEILPKFIEGGEQRDKVRSTVEDCKAKVTAEIPDETDQVECERALAFHACIRKTFPKFGRNHGNEEGEDFDDKSE